MNNSNNIEDILVPNLPESVVDATVAMWHNKEGDTIQANDIILEIETDKIMLEIPSPRTGVLEEILEKEGSIVVSGQVLGRLKLIDTISITSHVQNITENKDQDLLVSASDILNYEKRGNKSDIDVNSLSPAIRKLIVEYNLNIKDIEGSGIKGRITRQDVEMYIKKTQLAKKKDIIDNDFDHNISINIDNNTKNNFINIQNNKINRQDTRIKMSRLQQKVAERLLNINNSTAMLTTFNEVNMQCIMDLRHEYKELFEKRHNIKLGIMSFYVKAVLEGLRHFPKINAYIDEEEIVYHNYFDISIAISTDRGLVTPVLKDVDQLSIVDIEKKIKLLANKAREGKLTLEDLNGGNFTITNGGVFGSVMSTPIINPPQSAILGMHAIKKRPVVLNEQVVILPMMYLALSYDHRLIDGHDSIKFLIFVKELIENPIRLLLNV